MVEELKRHRDYNDFYNFLKEDNSEKAKQLMKKLDSFNNEEHPTCAYNVFKGELLYKLFLQIF